MPAPILLSHPPKCQCSPLPTASVIVALFAQNLNGRLAFSIFAIAFGSGFQHGYNTGVLNAPQGLISNWIRDCDQDDAGAGAVSRVRKYC